MKTGLRASGQLPICSLPLTLDTYDGCSGRCAYCFAQQTTVRAAGRGKGSAKSFEDIGPRSVGSLAKQLSGEGESAPARLARQRVPVHIGGMADPLQPTEEARLLTLRALEVFAGLGYPVVLSTKFDLLSREPWASVWDSIPHRLLQVSAFTMNKAVSESVEPGVVAIADRLRMAEAVAARGTPVVFRWQPYALPYSREEISGYVSAVKNAGGYGIVAEGLKENAIYGLDKCGERMSALLGCGDVRGGTYSVMDREYSPAQKKEFLSELRAACRGAGIRFFAADNDQRMMGDSPVCCGAGELPGFEGQFRGTWGYAAQAAYRTGKADFGAVREAMAGFSDVNLSQFVNSKNAVAVRQLAAVYGDASILSKMRLWWNSPAKANSPTCFMPQMRPCGKDANGDLLYTWEKDGSEGIAATGETFDALKQRT